MNRTDFMMQLERMLQNITPAEREEALQYYNDYFDDAGAENEQEVIEALGSPARVAENIKRDLSGNSGENLQRGALASDRAVAEYGRAEKNDYAEEKSGEESGKMEPPVAPEKKGMPGWLTALIVVGVILASPVLLGLAAALFGLALGVLGVLLGLLVAWFAIILAVAVTALSMFIVLGVLVGVGVKCLFVDPMVGIALIGGGLICGGIGILFLMLTVALAGIVTPAVFRGIGWIFRSKKKAK